MKAKLIRLDTNSAIPLEKLRSKDSDSFGFWLNASIGADEKSGADDFQIFVCNKRWLNRESEKQPKKYLLIEGEEDADAISDALTRYLDSCEGNSWQEIVDCVSRIGTWEFEGYKS